MLGRVGRGGGADEELVRGGASVAPSDRYEGGWFDDEEMAALALVSRSARQRVPGTASGDGDGDGDGHGGVTQRDFRFVVVTPVRLGPVLVGRGQRRRCGAEDMGVTSSTGARTFDMVEMSQLIDAAVASEPDGSS